MAREIEQRIRRDAGLVTEEIEESEIEDKTGEASAEPETNVASLSGAKTTKSGAGSEKETSTGKEVKAS